MLHARYARWIQGPAFTGWQAHFAGVLVVAVPTITRAAMNGLVTGCEFTPYLPFVLLSAILLRWWQAAGVALASVAIMGGLVTGSTNQLMAECFISAAGVFLAGSAVTIGTVVLMRRVFAESQARGVEESAGGIVFSLGDNNEVWASWYGSDQPVRLGTQDKVEYMMADFLAQGELGRRLSAHRN